MEDGDRDRETSRRDGRRDDERPRDSRRARSESESGTPDWLRNRRERGSTGEGSRRPLGDGGGGRDRGDRFGGGGKGGGGGSFGEVRPGDWSCSSCGMNNFARRTECFKCGAPKSSERDEYRSDGGGGARGDRAGSR